MERALLGAGAAGDRAAGEALLARMLPGIFGLCRRILGREDAAQDAAQETSARLCAQVRSGEEIRDVRKWAATVAMNLCFDERRRARAKCRWKRRSRHSVSVSQRTP